MSDSDPPDGLSTTDSPGATDDPDAGLSPAETRRLEAIGAARSLADLVALTEADSEHDAYFAARAEWFELQDRRLRDSGGGSGTIPGVSVTLDGADFHVHGITHAGTAAERDFLRKHVADFLAAGEAVYCEQGVRSMYFEGMDEVCEVDDYRWAMAECADLESDAGVVRAARGELEELREEIDSLRSRFRETAFSLIESGGDVYGDRFAAALGDVASDFLTSHEDEATGKDFEAFRRSREAAENPAALADLQAYYQKVFLPQPIEREWLRQHDPELEIVSHGRNERMADYVRYHHEDADAVHLIVGAAHLPGVRYYLERHRDGERSLAGFEFVE